MAISLDPAAVRHGRVRGRYFRENFAQGGFDLVQVLPEVVTNADAAIAARAAGTGRIDLRFAAPAPEFTADWKRELRRLGVPAAPSWRHELTCTDDGEGVDAAVVDRRLGTLGVVPERDGPARAVRARPARRLARPGRRQDRGRARRPRRAPRRQTSNASDSREAAPA